MCHDEKSYIRVARHDARLPYYARRCYVCLIITPDYALRCAREDDDADYAIDAVYCCWRARHERACYCCHVDDIATIRQRRDATALALSLLPRAMMRYAAIPLLRYVVLFRHAVTLRWLRCRLLSATLRRYADDAKELRVISPLPIRHYAAATCQLRLHDAMPA